MFVCTDASQDKFPQFVQSFMKEYHPDGKIPAWITAALATVGIAIDTPAAGAAPVD